MKIATNSVIGPKFPDTARIVRSVYDVANAAHRTAKAAGLTVNSQYSSITLDNGEKYMPLVDQSDVSINPDILKTMIAGTMYSLTQGIPVVYRIAFDIPGREDVVLVHELLKTMIPDNYGYGFFLFSFYVASKPDFDINALSSNKSTARALVPLYDPNDVTSVTSQVTFTASSHGGFSAYQIDSRFAQEPNAVSGHFSAVEPIKSVASSEYSAFASYFIGNSVLFQDKVQASKGGTMLPPLKYLMQLLNDPTQTSNMPYLYSITTGVKEPVGSIITGAFSNGSASIYYPKDGSVDRGNIAMIGLMNAPVKIPAGRLSYYAETGEKVSVPNGPMVISERIISQRLKMCALFDISAVPVGGFVNIIEPGENDTINSTGYIGKLYPTSLAGDYLGKYISVCLPTDN